MHNFFKNLSFLMHDYLKNHALKSEKIQKTSHYK